jgi:hypothetical protein
MNYFCQLLNVQAAGAVRQAAKHTAEPFAPETSATVAEVAVRKLKLYKSPGAGPYCPLGTIGTVPRAYHIFRAYEDMGENKNNN